MGQCLLGFISLEDVQYIGIEPVPTQYYVYTKAVYNIYIYSTNAIITLLESCYCW